VGGQGAADIQSADHSLRHRLNIPAVSSAFGKKERRGGRGGGGNRPVALVLDRQKHCPFADLALAGGGKRRERRGKESRGRPETDQVFGKPVASPAPIARGGSAQQRKKGGGKKGEEKREGKKEWLERRTLLRSVSKSTIVRPSIDEGKEEKERKRHDRVCGPDVHWHSLRPVWCLYLFRGHDGYSLKRKRKKERGGKRGGEGRRSRCGPLPEPSTVL